MYRTYLKRCLDIILASTGFIILLPVFLLVALSLLFINRENPFFIQSRPGKNNIIFGILKFKTMDNKQDENGNLLSDIDRMTVLGRLIRKYSLDEIPQLMNVIKGDMSLVGPRPLLTEYLPLYNLRQAKRQKVRPGLTGLAQVNGRNAISWQEKFDYDIWYVKHMSFKLDIKIIWKTIFKVLESKEVNSTKKITMEKFKGNNSI